MERLWHPGTTAHDVERPIYHAGGARRAHSSLGTLLLRWDTLWVSHRGGVGWKVWEGPQVHVCSVVTAGVDSAVDVAPAELQAAFTLQPLGMGHLKLIWRLQHSQRGVGFHSAPER